MSDLISRSELIKHFEAIQQQENVVGLEFIAMIDEIKEQPTAYDVDKVVEELKEVMQDLSVIEILSHIDFDSTIQSGLDNFLKAYNSELLRIVKNGGVYDDVCEWKYTSDGEFIQNPHTKRLYSNEPSMKNVYCNTCGKKIKAVEWWSNDN